MLQFIKRGSSVNQPIGDLPLWLSTLLRNRGVDTPEKAEAVNGRIRDAVLDAINAVE